MTVQTPPEPGHYPTTPPWANPAAPEQPPVPPHEAPVYSPAYKHGQLLVRFPGEVHAAGRPDAPSWRPVMVWTFFLSALGVISALRRSATAKRYGRRRRPYWIAFVASLLGGAAFWTLLTVNVAIPYYEYYQEDQITTVVQDTLIGDRRIIKHVGAVTSVACRPENERNSDGVRTYLCTFQLATGKSSGMYVEADDKGNWLEKE
ncbi:ECF transporter S component [Actinoplanes derwentensis]|uniref:Uncharacterized protein n=1 Tax=Actinoplanes derwentensis TaxID=113562 RepID=A0A1H2C6T1_9ACTN|nr:ECF transporter S component [Actinoplanes derwentensis]GID84242.1 hypothetical protein Ade03nite_31660 [Actinoplanes derwentensis]SDT66029.1 hypothetical protein SAMN04489716_5306 [Actinoplanes derwentensis]